MTKFNVGDRVRVTGDTGGTGQEFDDGTVGVIGEDFIGEWYVEGDYQVIGANDERWWVNEGDLELVTEGANSDAKVLTAITLVTRLDLPDDVKINLIKTLVHSL